ncbi:cell division protein FtsK [Bacillus endophyticus]|uniref:FtsK/SpoIIIE domain-containing protein n=1 Tax=Priestia endophytica TaxID=135735 RepID=UPI0018CF1276|nr:FtsK/SpoIIIE domain-containing protein [Priestia endophytica]MBG9812313.1 cell division protein FtsK [Priestia endophytica]MBG9812329.1 cell division protein FtsK [Priestia endophytica]MBG9812349.1 cell division protein FtsK [Priestia endophytica]MBG9812378.1 cell division protein FtsK [Priestia endophytica]
MWELVAIPALTGAVALWFGKNKLSEEHQVVQQIFEQYHISIKNGKDHQYPQLVRECKSTKQIKLIYRTPLALEEKTLRTLQQILSVTLNQEVNVSFKKWLIIDISKNKMPSYVSYQEVPYRKGWVVPLGKNRQGWTFHQFDHTPHTTISGTTRFGKTVMMKVMMTYLIEHHPLDVQFIIIDLKGGLEFNQYKNLQQVERVASDPIEALYALKKVQKDMKERMERFKREGWSNIVDTPISQRLFIFIDEAAQLTSEKFMEKEEKKNLAQCQSILSEIARIGGALGIRLVYGTQYPTSNVLNGSIKQNADLKISFRLGSDYASKVAIDAYGAETLPSDIKGRALIKTHEVKEVQVPYLNHEEIWKRIGGYEVAKQTVVPNETGEDYVRLG